jgi:hypothetical protein
MVLFAFSDACLFKLPEPLLLFGLPGLFTFYQCFPGRSDLRKKWIGLLLFPLLLFSPRL